MVNDVSIEYKGDHLHIRHGEGFRVTPETMDVFWGMLADACEKYDCSRVYAVGPAPDRDIDTVGAFRSGVQAAESAPELWLALCFQGYQTDELSELFKNAARNRGVHVKFFSDREQAHRWLGVGLDADDCVGELAA
jgi:hypothetical protein